MITSGGKRNPAKLDLSAGTRRERRRIDQACLILLSTYATDREIDHFGQVIDVLVTKKRVLTFTAAITQSALM